MNLRLTIIITLLTISISACKRSVSDIQESNLVPIPSMQAAVITQLPLLTNTPAATPSPEPLLRIHSADKALFNGDWEKALVEFQTAKDFSVDPQIQAAAWLGLGRTYLAEGQAEKATGELQGFIERFSQDARLPHAYYLLGQAYSNLEQYSQAAAAFSNYLNLRPGVIDAYVLEYRGDANFALGEYFQSAEDYRRASEAPSAKDTVSIKLKLARALGMAGDKTAALQLYDELYTQSLNEYNRALIDLRKGQIYTELGQIEQANQAYMDAVKNYPQAYDSYSALIALLDQGIEVDDFSRGLVDYYAGEYGVALSAFDRYLQTNPSDPASGHYYNGLTRRALGGYPDAIKEWDEIILNYPDHHLWDDAWEAKAYTQWAFQDDFSSAVQTLTGFVEKAPSHGKSAGILFEAGRLAERSGNLEKAKEIWEKLANSYPEDKLALEAMFQVGILHYRLRNYQEALNYVQRNYALSVALNDRARAHFWLGKTFNAMGNIESARASWSEAAGMDPTGYYSERARDILDGRDPFSPPSDYDLVVDWGNQRLKADDWLRNTFSIDQAVRLDELGALAGEAGLLRGLELWELGEHSQARSEFEELRKKVESDPSESYQLANFLINLGLYRSGIMAARQVLNLAGMDDATSLGAPAYFSNIRFGTYYSEMILPLATEYNFHPLFLFSVVRQESLFEGFVQSSAGARGLMQIIPATGNEIAERLVWPANYSESDLYRPLVSLKYGVDYLDRQRQLFDGDLFAALASYNGGPGNALEWKELAGGDQDLFLEIIRFEETRNYIRGIYEIFTLYRFVYNRTP